MFFAEHVQANSGGHAWFWLFPSFSHIMFPGSKDNLQYIYP